MWPCGDTQGGSDPFTSNISDHPCRERVAGRPLSESGQSENGLRDHLAMHEFEVCNGRVAIPAGRGIDVDLDDEFLDYVRTHS